MDKVASKTAEVEGDHKPIKLLVPPWTGRTRGIDAIPYASKSGQAIIGLADRLRASPDASTVQFLNAVQTVCGNARCVTNVSRAETLLSILRSSSGYSNRFERRLASTGVAPASVTLRDLRRLSRTFWRDWLVEEPFKLHGEWCPIPTGPTVRRLQRLEKKYSSRLREHNCHLNAARAAFERSHCFGYDTKYFALDFGGGGGLDAFGPYSMAIDPEGLIASGTELTCSYGDSAEKWAAPSGVMPVPGDTTVVPYNCLLDLMLSSLLAENLKHVCNTVESLGPVLSDRRRYFEVQAHGPVDSNLFVNIRIERGYAKRLERLASEPASKFALGVAATLAVGESIPADDRLARYAELISLRVVQNEFPHIRISPNSAWMQ